MDLPERSCNNTKILITRDSNNVIQSSTYEEIIIHFLRHLKREITYFGAIDIYYIIPEYLNKGGFSIGDEENYQTAPFQVKWQNRIRSVLDTLKSQGYIETVDSRLIPQEYQTNLEHFRQARTRKRTAEVF